MATKSYIHKLAPGRTHRFVWDDLGMGDVGKPISIPGAADMTFQVIQRKAGLGDVIILEGSCCEKDDDSYFRLRDGGFCT